MSDPPISRRAPGSEIGSSLGIQRLDTHAWRRLLLAMALLVEGRTVDAVREALHHERPVRHRGQQHRRDSGVVAKEVALRQLQLRPERLREIGDVQTLSTGQLDRAIFPGILERAQLIDHMRDGFGARVSGAFVNREEGR